MTDAIRPTYLPALEAASTQSAPNKKSVICKGTFKFEDPQFADITDCRIVFTQRWLPKPAVIAAITIGGPSPGITAMRLMFHEREQHGHKISVKSNELQGSGRWLFSNSKNGSMEGKTNGRFVLASRNAELAKIQFSLPNFLHVHGSAIAYPNGVVSLGRLRLTDGTWDIVLDERQDSSRVYDLLREKGGYAVTHVGELARRDGSAFTPEDASDVFDALHRFIAFAAARWCGTVSVVGRGIDNEIKYLEIDSKLLDSFGSKQGWFAHCRGQTLEDLWPRFLTKWRDAYTKKVLSSLIYLYVTASKTPGCDAGLIIAQTALELLAWSMFVESNHTVSSSGFDNLPTADKVRLLASELNLSSDFAAGETHLKEWAKDHVKGCKNRFWAMVEVRNRLVHPSKRDQLDDDSGAIWEAYNLSIYILELGILYFCDFRGEITDRINTVWVGTTSPVPWNSSTKAS